MLTIGSLFSGIGGLELGLENAGLGPVVWQVEIDEYARRILAKHWPNAKRGIQDVAQAGKATLLPVDLICGGFPCVDTSPAGRRTGLGGDTSGPLWRELSFVRGGSSSRTVPVSQLEDLSESSQTLPRSGILLSGYVCPLPTLASLTGAREPGSLPGRNWPTPLRSDMRYSRRHGYTIKGHGGTTLTDAVVMFHEGATRQPGQRLSTEVVPSPEFVEALMGFPSGWTDVD